MRRIVHNTTAIVACLSLMAPHIAMAQTNIPEAAAQKDADKLPANADVLAQAEAEPVPPAEAETAAPAEAEAEVPAEAETAAPVEAEAEAPAEAETAAPTEAEAEAPAEAETAAPVEAEAEAPAEAETTAPAEAEAEAPAEAETTAPVEAEAEAPAEAETTAPAEAEAEAPAEAETAAPVEAEAEAPAEAETTAPAEAEAEAPAEAETAAPAEAEAEAPAEAETTAPAEAEAEAPDNAASEDQDALAEALAEEEKASEGEAQPDDAAASEDPASPSEDDLADALAEQEKKAEEAGQEDSSQQPADAEGETESDDTAAGSGSETEGSSETEAAKEAATETEIPELSALTSEEGEGEVTEEEVTEENSRSSSEDFGTSLTDALSGLAGQEAQQSDDDSKDNDKSDLTKAVLLGLGGLAVGSMLSNNREVELSTPDRLVVTRADGSREVIKDETVLLRQPGSTVATENFDDGSSRTTVTRADGSKVVTIRDANLRVLRRTLITADGGSMQLIDDTTSAEPVDIASLPAPAEPIETSGGSLSEEELRAALLREVDAGRYFTLGQIRNIPEVRALVAPINIDAITFDTGSAAIKSDQAEQLSTLGKVIQQTIQENPREIFLIEGHTDSVGDAAMNLALSDRRAESVALALTEYFDVPPENLVTQGYGEQFPKVSGEGDLRENRRASVRRITDLLQTASTESE
ncbi:OmpA family protein [Paracoccus onubensis]|uniref:OmpA family protein n=1 Tax=Paracoccus onubensis TaxID=1675788 RepID=UPI0027314BC8|nr:OmpA family protein [Paracoccus onubensis]MDP0928917.1 OmpA family protein [Paracoccus onubensis]